VRRILNSKFIFLAALKMKSIYNIPQVRTTSTIVGGPLSGLNDVDLSGVQNNQGLVFNNGAGRWQNQNIVNTFSGRSGNVLPVAGDYDLTDLGDTNISGAISGQVLKYNGTDWTNSAETEGAYEVVYNFIPGFTVSAENNKFYMLGAGGQVNVDNMQPGQRVMVSSNANPIVVQFGPTYFILNSNFSGGTAGVTCNLTACTVEFYCSDSFGSQRYFHITRVSQNRNGSIFTINGQKYSALNSLNNIPDINITSPSNGQGLVYNSGVWTNQTISSNLSLDDLTDVSISSLVPFSILAYDGTEWRNFPYSESVTSVFGRLGNVVAQGGDYSINQISGISPLASGGVVNLTSPSNGQVLRFNGTQWINATNILSFNSRTGAVVPASGDYSIAQITNSSVLASTTNVNITTPSNGQILSYNGTQWINTNSISAPVTSFNSRTGAILPASNDYNINQLAGVLITSPTTNQQLIFNGTNWVNGSAASGVSSFNTRTGAVSPASGDYSITQISGASFLAESLYVNISIPQNNDFVVWDAPTQKFVNRQAPTNFMVSYCSQGNLVNNNYFRGAGTGTAAQAVFVMPRQCSVRSITGYVSVTNSPGVGWRFRVTKNGVPTGLEVDMLGTLGANKSTNPINFNQYEFMQIQMITIGGTPLTATGGCTVEII
jgi:hypothetical protein